MAATKGRHHYTERFRQRIKSSLLQKRLQEHALGTLEKPMDATQIRAAEILLKKCVPDLTAVEHSGEVTQRTAVELTDEQLAAIATGSGQGTTEAQAGPPRPSELH